MTLEKRESVHDSSGASAALDDHLHELQSTADEVRGPLGCLQATTVALQDFPQPAFP